MTNGYQPDWDFDVVLGEDGEQWVTNVALNPEHGECKVDRKFPETGNLYIEYECLGRDGIWRPSGLASTKAELWVHVLGVPPAPALVISTERLKEICRPLWRNGRKAEERDGSNPTKGVLVNLVELVAALSPAALARAQTWQRRLAKDQLALLAELPFAAPPWCPEEEWRALDKAITKVATRWAVENLTDAGLLDKETA